MAKKKAAVLIKENIHPRSQHRGAYDFDALIESVPSFSTFVRPNKHGNTSIDFGDPAAVKALNAALLRHHYDVVDWDLPADYLCPAVPGRADYIHHLADMLASFDNNQIPKGPKIKGLDIGVGANCIYPLVANKEYGWTFVATDIDTQALKNVSVIIAKNPQLKDVIECRLQQNEKQIIRKMIWKDDYFDFTVCNPPYYESAEQAAAANLKKSNNLKKTNEKTSVSNFGGKNKELWCEGGELYFVLRMIKESKNYKNNCFLFSSLISNKLHLEHLTDELKRVGATHHEIISMSQGHKASRILAWTFLTEKARSIWINHRWAK